MRMVLFEDKGVSALAPLSLTRPVFELRCGATCLFEVQQELLGADEVAVLIRPEMVDLYPLIRPNVPVADAAWLGKKRVVLVNGRWLPPKGLKGLPEASVGLIGDEVAYVALPAGAAQELSFDNLAWQLEEWCEQLPCHAAGGTLLRYPWDLLTHHDAALEHDYQRWQAKGVSRRPDLPIVGPAERFLAAASAQIEPMVVIDTTRGPVLVDEGATVQAFTRLEGPCYVGRDTHLLAARLRGSSVGPQCRIGGEVEVSIIQGYSNKGHEGFLGHSVVGEWVNLGAGTQVSDLRTDYGVVRMKVDGVSVDTGLIKLGALIGDHTKTSINTLLNTGSSIGAFSLLLTTGTLLPRRIPSFCQIGQGELQARNDLRQMFAAAERMMKRRSQQWTPAHSELFFTLFDQTAAERDQLLRESEQRRLRRQVI